MFIEDVDYYCVELVCELVSCHCWRLEKLRLSNVILKPLKVELLKAAETTGLNLTWWTAFDGKQPRDQVVVGYFVHRVDGDLM